jgi:hypothetical protein
MNRLIVVRHTNSLLFFSFNNASVLRPQIPEKEYELLKWWESYAKFDSVFSLNYSALIHMAQSRGSEASLMFRGKSDYGVTNKEFLP